MIKAILFDMVGVLVFKQNGFSPKSKDELDAENIEKLFNHLDDRKLIADVKKVLNLTDEEILKATESIPEKYERYNNLWKLLPRLKKKCKLAVINNGNSIALKYWKEKFGFKDFDLFLNSAEEGVKKPDPKIFLLACKKLRVKPEECLFMDDSLENIESAQKLGMQTIWWDDKKDRKTLLREFFKGLSLTKHEAVFALIFNKGKLLLFHRDDKTGIPYPNYWHLPGGRKEPNETPRQAMKRELGEEITHIPKNLKYVGKTKKGDGFFSHTYLSVVDDGEAELFKLGPGEGQEIKFFTRDEIAGLKITEVLEIRMSLYKDLFQKYGN